MDHSKCVGTVRMVRIDPSVVFRLDVVRSSRFAGLCLCGSNANVLEWLTEPGGLVGDYGCALCYRPWLVLGYDEFIGAQVDVGYSVWYRLIPRLNTYTTHSDYFYAKVMNFAFYLRSHVLR